MCDPWQRVSESYISCERLPCPQYLQVEDVCSFDINPESISVPFYQTVIVHANEDGEILNLFGNYSVLGLQKEDFIHFEKEKLVKGGKLIYERRSKKYGSLPVEAIVSSLPNDTTNIKKTIAKYEIIETYNLTKTKLKTLEQKANSLKTVIDSLGQVLCQIDKNMMFTYVSPECESAWGYSPHELISYSFWETVTVEQMDHVCEELSKLICGVEKSVRIVLMRQTKHMGIIFEEASVVLVGDNFNMLCRNINEPLTELGSLYKKELYVHCKSNDEVKRNEDKDDSEKTSSIFNTNTYFNWDLASGGSTVTDLALVSSTLTQNSLSSFSPVTTDLTMTPSPPSSPLHSVSSSSSLSSPSTTKDDIKPFKTSKKETSTKVKTISNHSSSSSSVKKAKTSKTSTKSIQRKVLPKDMILPTSTDATSTTATAAATTSAFEFMMGTLGLLQPQMIYRAW